MKKILALIFVLFIITACSSERKEPDDNSRWIDVYYADSGADMISSEQRAIDAEESITAQIKDSIEQMQEKPIGRDLAPLIPQKVKLVGAKLDQGIAKLEFSEEYLELYGMDKTLADYGILMTLSNFWNIKGIEISVGETIVTPKLSQEDIVTELPKRQS